MKTNTVTLDNVYLIEGKQYRKGTPFTIKEFKSTDSDIVLTKSIRVNDKILETGTVIREGIVKVTEKRKPTNKSHMKEANDTKTWDMAEKVSDAMGYEAAFQEIILAMDVREAHKNLEWIIRQHDL